MQAMWTWSGKQLYYWGTLVRCLDSWARKDVEPHFVVNVMKSIDDKTLTRVWINYLQISPPCLSLDLTFWPVWLPSQHIQYDAWFHVDPEYNPTNPSSVSPTLWTGRVKSWHCKSYIYIFFTDSVQKEREELFPSSHSLSHPVILSSSAPCRCVSYLMRRSAPACGSLIASLRSLGRQSGWL